MTRQYTESQREQRRKNYMARTGKPMVRRLALVPRGPHKNVEHPLGLTDVQARVIDALMRLGECTQVAAELQMKPSTVRVRITNACRRAGYANSTLLLLAWAKCKWDSERVGQVWRGLAA